MKSLMNKAVLLFWFGAMIAILPGCAGNASSTYWSDTTCAENPSDRALKPEVADELRQYGAQFSSHLMSAADKALAGDLSVLRQLRNSTAQSAMIFSKEGIRIEDVSIKQGTGTLRLRIYFPSECSQSEALPVVIYCHGGGWIFGSAAGADHIAAGISRTARAVVISVDYRLAPENPFPAALEDCAGAIQWARRHVSGYHGNPDRIYLAGDSAGGNLAASSAVCESMSGRRIQGIILYYPAVDLGESNTGSMKRFASGYGLDAGFLKKVIRCYIPDPAVRTGYMASPVNADPRHVPPALIITAQFDILRDDAKKFAGILSRTGNRVRYLCIPGVTHAYLDSSCCAPEFLLTMKETSRFIARTSAAAPK